MPSIWSEMFLLQKQSGDALETKLKVIEAKNNDLKNQINEVRKENASLKEENENNGIK